MRALAKRTEPKDSADAIVFVTSKGGSWHKKIEDNPISKEMRKLLDSLKIDGHRNFYALRHTFETIGGEAKDQIASITSWATHGTIWQASTTAHQRRSAQGCYRLCSQLAVRGSERNQ